MATTQNVDKKVTDREFSVDFNNAVILVGSKGKLVTVYYPYGKSVEEVGLFVGYNGCLVADHLPVTGYGYSNFYPEDIDKKFVIMRNKVYTYKESRFLDPEKVYKLLCLEDGTIHDVFVHIVPSGVSGTKYAIDYDYEVEYFYNNDYGKKFVILNTEERIF